MKLLQSTAALLFTLSATASAQLLANGNSQFPSCAASCTLLNQAAQACGGTTTATQQIWSCFCQSAYLTGLYTSPSGICDAFCTNPSDNQQVMTWYKSNCGTDHAASEHADAAAATTASSSLAAAMATSSNPALPSTTSSGGTVHADSPVTSGGSWWSTHYKWVIMLIVIFVGLLLFAIVAVWLKRRHGRKRDQISGGFNAGITSRSAPMSENPAPADTSLVNTSMVTSLEAGGGRDSPARTREAFMPYGYGYARSESRLASPAPAFDGRKSPLARVGTPVDELEKDVGVDKKRRVLVRERGREER